MSGYFQGSIWCTAIAIACAVTAYYNYDKLSNTTSGMKVERFIKRLYQAWGPEGPLYFYGGLAALFLLLGIYLAFLGIRDRRRH